MLIFKCIKWQIMVKLIEEEAMVSNQEIMSSDYTSGQTLNN